MSTTDLEDLPRSAKGMGSKMRELAPGLRQIGIDVRFHEGHARTIEIRRGANTAGDEPPNDGEPGG
jgi:hypothetical protein